MCICLLINEKGLGFLSGYCSCKLLKFIDFFKILGGVPVLSLPIENFKFSIVSASLIEDLSSTLPACFLVEPILINPLKKVPVVNTKLLQIIYSPPFKITPEILLLLKLISSTDPSSKNRFLVHIDF